VSKSNTPTPIDPLGTNSIDQPTLPNPVFCIPQTENTASAPATTLRSTLIRTATVTALVQPAERGERRVLSGAFFLSFFGFDLMYMHCVFLSAVDGPSLWV
jgi:hypothetical protein